MRSLNARICAVSLLTLLGTGIWAAKAGEAPTLGEETVPPPSWKAPSDWLGYSGNLRAFIDTPAALQQDPLMPSELVTRSLGEPGIHDIGLTAPDGDTFYVLSLMPFEEKQDRSIKNYRIGSWPQNGTLPSRYAHPAGFIEVTEENQHTRVSRRFHLRDFLTHDQATVWPKFLVLKPTLVDKLELISTELQARGLPSRLHVMSGFRTPQYNERGVGPKGGRASLSRHMYGDAADVFVDQDVNGRMDDLDKDGKVTVKDARVLYAVAESVEDRYPALVGGLSPYRATAAHGPFVHVDVRGVKARW